MGIVFTSFFIAATVAAGAVFTSLLLPMFVFFGFGALAFAGAGFGTFAMLGAGLLLPNLLGLVRAGVCVRACVAGDGAAGCTA